MLWSSQSFACASNDSNLPDKSLYISFMYPFSNTAPQAATKEKDPLYLADLRVYPRAVSEAEVKVLSDDPEVIAIATGSSEAP